MKINRTGSISVLTQPIIFFKDSWFCIPMRVKLDYSKCKYNNIRNNHSIYIWYTGS